MRGETERETDGGVAMIKTNGGRQRIRKALLWSLCAMGLTLLCTLIATAINGVAPIGKNTVLYSDLLNEYTPYLTELYDKLKEGGSLFWSWRTGVGSNFWGHLCYYLLSPFNCLVVLVGRSQIIAFLSVLIVVRQMLAACSMTLFLSLRKNGGAGWQAALCGFLYANCGWFLSYYYTVIWLEAFWLLPLLALGIERLAERRRPGLYAAALTGTLFANFYAAWFSCLFAVIYYLSFYYMYLGAEAPKAPKAKKTKKDAAKQPKAPFYRTRFFRTGCLFAGVSVWCVVLLGVIFVPLLALLAKNDENAMVPVANSFFESLPEHFAELFSGTKTHGASYSSTPNIYMGILPLAALPLFFLSGAFTKRQKRALAAVLLLFALSFNIKYLDYVWHGFRYPTSLPFRESFLFSFFGVAASHSVLLNRPEAVPHKKSLLADGAVLGVLLFFAAIYCTSAERAIIGGIAISVTAILFAAFTALLRVRAVKKTAAVSLAVVTALLTFADVCYTASNNFHLLEPETQSKIIRTPQEYDSLSSVIDDEPFYRTEFSRPWYDNCSALLGYRGLFQSASVVNSSFYHFLSYLGFDSNFSNYEHTRVQPPTVNSILDVKYLLERDEWIEGGKSPSLAALGAEGYGYAAKENAVTAYRYRNTFGLGAAVSARLAEWSPEAFRAPENNNDFFSLACGAAPILTEIPVEKAQENPNMIAVTQTEDGLYAYSTEDSPYQDYAQLDFSLTAQRDGAVYLYFEMASDYLPAFTLTVGRPDRTSEGFFDIHKTMFSNICNAKAGDTVQLTFYPDVTRAGTFAIRAFQVDTRALETACAALSAHTLTVERAEDDCIQGRVTIPDGDSLLFTSIPYDEGWTVTADGVPVAREDVIALGGGLLGVRLPEGEHTVAFRYRLPGLGTGIAVTLFAAAAAPAAYVFDRKRNHHGLS